VRFLSPLLFWMPGILLHALEQLWVDRLVFHRHWSKFTDKLNTEWREITFIVIVLINTNVTFLSIASVDHGGDVIADRSPAQIVSYISIITGLGSLLLSQLLIRHTQSFQSAGSIAAFLGKMTHETYGLEVLAILYALPYALLKWSSLSFLVAFLCTCFFSSSSTSRTLVGVVLGTVSMLVMWCIWTGWTTEIKPDPQKFPMDPSEESSGTMPHNVAFQDGKACIDSPTGRGPRTKDENQSGRSQWSWPYNISSTLNQRGGIDSDHGVKAEV